MVSVALAGVIHEPISYAQVKTVVEPSYTVVETPTVNHVGNHVKTFPSATSYQSQTQYHSKNVVENVYAPTVEKQLVSTPIVKQVVQPVAVQYSAPAVHYAEPHYAQEAYIQAPIAYAPKALSYSSYPAVHQYAASYPAVHSAYSSYPAVHSAYSPYAHHY